MIPYLLALLLIIGFVDSQTFANMTNRWTEMNKVEQNHTFNVSTLNTSTMTAGNVTSGLYIDESEIESELRSNETSVITEDQESFQDQDNKPLQYCVLHEVELHCKEICVQGGFDSEMHDLSTEDWCVMEKIIAPYNNMTLCMELVSQILGCYYPNRAIQALFLQVHTRYFHNCTKEELLFEDAPQWLVITLTLIPVSLIPMLTYLVVWKSKVQD